jgi:hypothetical protein
MIFCTYFDSRYLPQARVCLQTLLRNGRGLRIYVLALDDAAYAAMSGMDRVVPISLAEMEAYRPTLLSIKSKRQKKEYYATLTPVLPQLVFEVERPNEVYYTDADMAFWGPVQEIADEMGTASLMVVPHENPVAYAAGRFNVGIVGYRNDEKCLKFLKWWEERCMEWCEWRNGGKWKMADQKYLDVLHDEPGMFANVKICRHPGIDLGPWNLVMHQLGEENGHPTVDGRMLVSYHYHGYRPAGRSCVNDTGWEVSDEAMRILYEPYHALMLEALAKGAAK